jgi:TolA-binding protein
LKLAVDLLAAGQRQPAHRRLREILSKYPGTSAADEAEKLLNE